MVKYVELPLDEAPPLTPEEREQMRVALERMRVRRERLLAERGGRLFPDSGAEVRAMRDAREAGYE